ncbi:hypothetical protein PNEG_03178 [Pneumocystis murina B123]|uniref:Uncharacterized protein n=1 Tax=Pneumocystis murina (strain B123) TaxID=1069680 RepID=M7NIE5_PNEMU|nr:hypothetical protein PNEG_03178 [Pneumocystis murina B123]EMR08338.1 hypothetical protein PNEG_03178 [Pneumocystis murina B123]
MNLHFESTFGESLESSFNWFNHSMTLTRLTPFFNFSEDCLMTYSRDLLDIIRRTRLPRLPVIEMCRWNLIAPHEGLGSCIWLHFLFAGDQTLGKSITYTCLLVSLSEKKEGWREFPLLISRIPGELLQVVLNYLTSRFDSWAMPFQLKSMTLIDLLQMYVKSVDPATDDACQPLELMFLTKSIKGLRRIIVGVKGRDMLIWRERELGFFEGLKKYLFEQTTIDFNKLELCRIGCAGFIISSEGKLKILKPIQLQIITAILKMEARKNMEMIS